MIGIGMKQIKLLIFGIISLMIAYWTTAWASGYIGYLESGEGMTIGIIGVFSASFLALMYFIKV